MKKKLVWLEGLLVFGPFILLAVFWSETPARVPIHWNLHGRIDGWGSKLHLLILPLASFGIVVLVRVLPWLDPKLRGMPGPSERMRSALDILRLALSGCFFILFLHLLAAAMGYSTPVRLVPTAFLLLFAILGNYLGVLRPNYFIGLRTPWTLERPETWRATHRFGGRLLCFGSLALLLLQFVLSESVFFILFTAAILLFAAWTLLYSWRHFSSHAATRSHG